MVGAHEQFNSWRCCNERAEITSASKTSVACNPASSRAPGTGPSSGTSKPCISLDELKRTVDGIISDMGLDCPGGFEADFNRLLPHTVQVIAVLHTSRDPLVWQSRTH